MKYLTRYLWFVYFLFFTFKIDAQSPQLEFKTFTEKEGLNLNYITCIHQDKNGFIWMGSFFGINKYDGTRLTSFIPNQIKPYALRSNYINQIEEDSSGLLWVASESGLEVLDPVTDRIISVNEYIAEFPAMQIRKIILDKSGNIWFYTRNNIGVTFYKFTLDMNKLIQFIRCPGKRFPQYKLQVISKFQNQFKNIQLFMPYDNSNILVCNNRGIFYTFSFNTQEMKPVSLMDLSLPITKSQKRIIFSKVTGRGVVINNNENYENIYTLDQMGELIPYNNGSYIECSFFEKNIRLIQRSSSGGLYYENDSFLTFNHPLTYSRWVEKTGRIWIGTIGYGIHRVQNPPSPFNRIGEGIKFYNTSMLGNGIVWPGYLDDKKLVNLITKVKSKPLWAAKLTEISEIKNVLLHSNKQHIYILGKNREDGFLKRYNLTSEEIEDLKLPSITVDQTLQTMVEDDKGNIWISGLDGELLHIDTKSGKYKKWDLKKFFPEDKGPQLVSRDLIFLKNGTLWIANNYGLIRVMPKDDEIDVKTFHNQGKKKLFYNNGIFSIKPDPKQLNVIWLGTMGGGLASFDVDSEKLTYHEFTGERKIKFAGNLTYDKFGNLWMSTERGIKCYSTSLKHFIHFFGEDKLMFDDINFAPSALTVNDNIMFPTGNGLISINPENLLSIKNAGHIRVSDVRVNDIPLYEIVSDIDLTKNHEHEFLLDLKHDQNNVSFYVSSPEAIYPEEVNFLYKIQGLSDTWHIVDSHNKIELNGLGQGNYIVEIKATADAEAETLLIPIRIRPPWYASSVAAFIYLLIIFGVIYSLFLYDRKRLILQHAAALHKEEAEKHKALNNFISRFFGFLAHEFKTPLSIIRGINDELRHDMKTEKNAVLFDSAARQSNTMLEIIDEMIDMTRLNSGDFTINYLFGDIVIYTREIISTFQPLIKIHQIKLVAEFSEDHIYMDFDPNRLKYVINNLLSNALRFTPKNGIITVKVQKYDVSTLSITVQDTGAGIPENELDSIFDIFNTSNINAYNPESNNFGLGLAFVKEIVSKMEGTVTVSSILNQGSNFKVLLPIRSRFYTPGIENGLAQNIPDNYFLNAQPSQARSSSSSDLPVALLVDDQAMVLDHLERILKAHFTLLFAKNGKDAFDLLQVQIPDIIVSDIMMPDTDGLQFLKMIKNKPETRHIPVIILSAKAETADRIEAQKAGAEMYFVKPNHDEELLMAMINMCKLKKSWISEQKLSVSGEIKSDLSEIEDLGDDYDVESDISTGDDHFLKQIYTIFEEHYMHESFDTDQLCKIMHISRAQLYRKLATMSDSGAMELLRNFRLEKAFNLLKGNPDLSTKEVAYMVGFKERSHFSTLFSKKFNISPKEMKRKKD